MAIHGAIGNFLHTAITPMTKVEDAATGVGSTLGQMSSTVNRFADMMHNYRPDRLAKSMVNRTLQHVTHTVGAPFEHANNAASQGIYKFNKMLKAPILQAERIVTRPIDDFQAGMNRAINSVRNTVSSPFQAAENLVSAPGNFANRIQNGVFGKIDHGLHGIQNKILSSLFHL